MAETEDLTTYIDALLAWEESTVGWGPTYLNFLTALGVWAEYLPTAFAPAVHSHDGAGGEVMGIGTSDARPAVTNGYILSATDTEQIEMLDASGNLIAAAAMQGKPLPLDEQASDPSTAANQIKVYAKESGGSAALFMRRESDGEVVEITGAALGYRAGCIVWYYNSSNIFITGGEIEINGLSSLISSQLTKSVTGLSNSTWYYVTAKAPASGRTLSASEIEYSSTAPTISHAKAGKYYDAAGTGRLLGVFRTDASGNIESFVASLDGWVEIGNPITFLGPTSSPATSDTLVSSGGPALGMMPTKINFKGSFSNAVDYNGYMAPGGIATLDADNLIIDTNGTGDVAQRFDMLTGPSNQYSYKWDWPGGGTLYYRLAAFKLPL